MWDISMNIAENGDCAQLSIRGSLSFFRHGDFSLWRRRALDRTGGSLTVDLSGMTHIDLAGIGMLSALRRDTETRGIGFRLRGASETVAGRLRVGSLVAD